MSYSRIPCVLFPACRSPDRSLSGGKLHTTIPHFSVLTGRLQSTSFCKKYLKLRKTVTRRVLHQSINSPKYAILVVAIFPSRIQTDSAYHDQDASKFNRINDKIVKKSNFTQRCCHCPAPGKQNMVAQS